MKKNAIKILLIVILTTIFLSVGFFVVASEKDVNGIHCLMTKWKSKNFLIALDVLIDLKISNAETYKSEIQSKLNAICSSIDNNESKQAINNLLNYYQEIKNNLNKLDKEQKQEIKKSINRAIPQKENDYLIYQKQAFQKRKELILKTLDEKIKNNTDKIRTLLNQQDANAFIKKLQALRDKIGSQIQEALNNSDEENLNLSISELKTEWDTIREEIKTKLIENQQ
ncbi:MAG: hypothetical protein V1686_02730 [Patescibacteria group bacterium]